MKRIWPRTKRRENSRSSRRISSLSRRCSKNRYKTFYNSRESTLLFIDFLVLRAGFVLTFVSQVFPPLPQPKAEPPLPPTNYKPMPPPPTPDDDKVLISGPSVPPTEAKLISILTAFLMVHPLGASLDYLVSYVRSMTPNVTQATVLSTLQKYADIFNCQTTGIGACIEHRWSYVTFDIIKTEK